VVGGSWAVRALGRPRGGGGRGVHAGEADLQKSGIQMSGGGRVLHCRNAADSQTRVAPRVGRQCSSRCRA
jgi:hypothetical protein